MLACCVVCVIDQVSSGHESEHPWILLDWDQPPQRAELFRKERLCSFLQNDTAHSQVSIDAQLKAGEHLGGNLSFSADYKCTSCPPTVIAVIHKKICQENCGSMQRGCFLLTPAVLGIKWRSWHLYSTETLIGNNGTKLMTASWGSVCYRDAEDFKMSGLSEKKIASCYID